MPPKKKKDGAPFGGEQLPPGKTGQEKKVAASTTQGKKYDANSSGKGKGNSNAAGKPADIAGGGKSRPGGAAPGLMEGGQTLAQKKKGKKS